MNKLLLLLALLVAGLSAQAQKRTPPAPHKGMKIIIINGVNMDLLGVRDPETYGTKRFEPFLAELRQQYPDVQIEYFQSNIEGEIVNKIHEVGFSFDGIIMNPGAFAHYSYAIADAISSVTTKVVEVHMSNIHARDAFREHSVTGKNSRGVIAGLGLPGYRFALESFLQPE